MMIFLTSSPTGDLDGRYTCEGFDPRNGFRDRLKAAWKKDARVLMIAAAPDAHRQNDEMTDFFRRAAYLTGLSWSAFDLWDGRGLLSGEMNPRPHVSGYDIIFLGGGHVPTQNAFFRRIGLAEQLRDFDGVLVGISAGSMNAAGEVYAQPEEPGEAVDPEYRRFLPGLGLTDINILPHYQMVKDNYLDGLHLFREITEPDCRGRRALAIPDGSFLEIGGGVETVHGPHRWL